MAKNNIVPLHFKEKQAEYIQYATQKLSETIMNGLTDKSYELLLKIAKSGFGVYDCKGKALEITDYLKTELDNKVGGVWKKEKWASKNHISLSQLHNIKEIKQYYEVLKLEAQNMQFESYLLYLEKNRPPKERFYAPKIKQYQKIGVINALQRLIDDETDILCISMPPGTGKGSHPDDLILTPKGYKRFGDIQLGDKVIAGNGKECFVKGIYPQGQRDFYKFTFDDGSSCRVSDNHLWKCQTRDDRRRGNKYRIAETSNMLKNFKVENGKRCNYSIDYVPRIDFEKKNYLIHPYVLGALLGNGYLSQTVMYSTANYETVERINGLLPNGYELKYKDKYDYRICGHEGNNNQSGSLIVKELKKYGLYNKHSYDKFIPNDYLYGSYDDRLELLRGLLDTDSYAETTGIEYSTVSEQLAHNVCDLVHSLGGYCSITYKEKTGYYDDNGIFVECRPCYRLTIQFSANQPSPYFVERKKETYKPKRKELKRFITNIEYIGKCECNCILVSDACHLYITNDYIITHNTTLEKFFHSAVMGWFPDDYNLFFSHSSDITRMYYDGVLTILTNGLDYTWHEIFPTLAITSTNAKMMQINIGKYKPFQNLMTASVGSEMSGKVRASKFLFVDDMIGKIEEALNKNTLDKLWGIYTTDARQRKVEGCKELIIATRWSVNDVIGRLQRAYADSDRCEFIAVEDIDEATGQSNFDFEFNGFTVEFFHDQEKLMDDISYKCLYKNQPIEREGLLYHEEELRRYLEMPQNEPDAIIGVCDTKNKGTDFLVLPCFYQYGGDFYMIDTICTDSSDYGVQYGRMANLIVDNNMQQVEFESNSGGDRVAFEVEKLVKEKGGRCNITTKPTETNKETRIIVNADWVKKHCLFKDKSMYGSKTDYGRFMDWLLCYSLTGKNAHDDVPDALANFALFVTKLNRKPKPTGIIRGGLL